MEVVVGGESCCDLVKDPRNEQAVEASIVCINEVVVCACILECALPKVACVGGETYWIRE